MVRRLRRGFTPAEKSEMWDRWQRGESLSSIGRAFGKESSSIHFQISPYGGVRPAPRRRSRLALTLLEREEISRGIVARQSARSMARQLGRSPSTVSREIKRNGKELMIVLRRRFSLWVKPGPPTPVLVCRLLNFQRT